MNSASLSIFKAGCDFQNTLDHYFEVTIVSGGYEDDIVIGVTIDGNQKNKKVPGGSKGSIGYHSQGGILRWNNNEKVYGAKYGSYDVIGCGVLKSGAVYFTHNGLALPIIQVGLTGPIYPAVVLSGKGSAVKINYGRENDDSESYEFYTEIEKKY